jgi:hypothetical protein
VYRGSGHDEIQPEECCKECMKVAQRLAIARRRLLERGK